MYHFLFICLASFLFLPLEASSKNSIFIYAGPGASQDSLAQTVATCESVLKSNYSIEYIYPEQLINDNWEEKAALLIIPGGADIPYTKALNGIGNQRIRSYVENGGSYLGLCAGSYYAGSFVDFAKDTPLEVQGPRELSFFPGIVRGPVLAPYDYKSEQGARAAQIIWKDADEVITVYYNGGGYFVDADKSTNTTVLATYAFGKGPAIIECRIGTGKAILSGVHFEYDPNLLDHDDIYLQQIIPILRNENPGRLKLVKHLLERLGL